MKSYPQYQVFIPACFPSEAPNRQTALNIRVIWDETQQKLIFGSSDRKGLNEPVSLNPQAKLLEVYTAIVAVAWRRGMIRKFPTPPTCWEPKSERAGVINGRTVADVKSYATGGVVRYADLTKDEIKIICLKYLNPNEDKYNLWAKITRASTVTRVEDYVALTKDEAEALRVKAAGIIEATTPTNCNNPKTKEKYEFYEFNMKELDFAPNSVWAAWAIANARKGDEVWIRNTYEADYTSGQLKISWSKGSTQEGNGWFIQSNFFSKYGKSKKTVI